MAEVAVGRESDVAEGVPLRVVVEGTPIAIFKVHDELFAIGDTCTHEEFSLTDGEMVDEFTVECALHGARFDLRSGRALCLPAVLPTPSYPVWVEDGVIKLDYEEE
ncbi:MAG TPA: non-heme iron oxygenase ferredoxin subunit [Ktedonobacterales bacterium]|nr:non-heme iron oxygenase ferredoxin subunit [Ktedonobacterales bacterium]